MIKAVFLDIDNTLLSFDGYVKQTMEKGFREFGLRPYEPWMYEAFTAVNDSLWRQIETGELDFPRLQERRWKLVFEKLGIRADGPVFERYFRAQLYESAVPVEGAMELLETLSGRTLLAAASNGPELQQRHRLELAGMDRYLDYIFISERIGIQKPEKGFFEYAFREINRGREEKILPADCLMVGDSLTSDVEGGRRAGMRTCYYRGHRKEDPAGAADFAADSLREVTESVLRELNGYTGATSSGISP